MAYVFRTIGKNDISSTPFKAHKNWYFDDANYSSSYGAEIFIGHSSSSLKVPIGDQAARNFPTNSNGSYQKVIWESANHLFYNYPKDPTKVFGDDDTVKSHRFLGERMNVFSMPQELYGEHIKRGSVTLTDNSRSGSFGSITSIQLRDDRKENLIDDTINTGSFASSSALVTYWGFNELYINRNTTREGYHRYAKDGGIWNMPAYINQVKFMEGIRVTGDATDRSGIQAKFNGTGSLRVDNDDKINFRSDKDFAISFWMEAPPSQADTNYTTNILFDKDGKGKTLTYNTKTKTTSYPYTMLSGRYPYKIEIYNQTYLPRGDRGKIKFSKSDTINTSFVTSSSSLTGSQFHVVCQKNGSNLELWVDGTLENSKRDSITGDVHNISDLWIGGAGRSEKFYSGSLDEIRIYNEALPAKAIASLANNHYISSSAYQTKVAGNIFYAHGLIYVSSNLPKYKYMLTGHTGSMSYGNNSEYGFNLDLKGAHTIYENQVTCRLKSSDFNLSMNPTLRLDNNANSSQLKGFTSSSSFHPYVTQIGLYNDAGEMLAIGKLASPLRRRNDINQNIIVRWDY